VTVWNLVIESQPSPVPSRPACVSGTFDRWTAKGWTGRRLNGERRSG